MLKRVELIKLMVKILWHSVTARRWASCVDPTAAGIGDHLPAYGSSMSSVGRI